MQAEIELSWRELRTQFKLRRLVTEDDGVKGPGWSRWSNMPGHTHLNIIRVTVIILFSFIWVFIPKSVSDNFLKKKKKNWFMDHVHTPPAVLNNPHKGGRPAYDTPHSRPKWMVEIEFKGGVATTRQVLWDSIQIEDLETDSREYSAISYSLESAEATFQMRRGFLPSPDGGTTRKYLLPTRVMISRIVLDEYVNLRQLASGADRHEYVWFDECCLHDLGLPPGDPEIGKQRSAELGRLADIFSGAESVVIFCHKPNCLHTKPKCPWGNRLFTLAEIYFAKTVQIMTLSPNDSFTITRRHGRDFKHDMQREATLGSKEKNWHLSAVMEHATQSSAASWQLAIHYIIVETIRRDLAGGFVNHEYLGRSLNGLLPRRSILNQFSGNGWTDLSWMLELNQGYYNAAALAAVCSLAEHNSLPQSWLGKPIAPKVGNERLEPLVTAFPVPTGLNFLNPRVVKLQSHLERDENGLHTNVAMQGLKITSLTIAAILVLAAFAGVAFTTGITLILLWLASAQYAFAHLVAGSMYVKRKGWIVIDGAALGTAATQPVATPQSPGKNTSESKPNSTTIPSLVRTDESQSGVATGALYKWLRERDHQLGRLTVWGRDQLVPEWETPNPANHPTRPVLVLDLQHGVCAKTIILNKDNDGENARKPLKLPDYLVPLAVHGCGVTCMLLESYKEPFQAPKEIAKRLRNIAFLNDAVAQKMGMVNLPPHILTSGTLIGSLRVGENDEFLPQSTPRSSLSSVESKV